MEEYTCEVESPIPGRSKPMIRRSLVEIVGCGHDTSILGNLTARARRSVKPQDRAAGCGSEFRKTKIPPLSHDNGPLDARRCEVIHV